MEVILVIIYAFLSLNTAEPNYVSEDGQPLVEIASASEVETGNDIRREAQED